jgi:predicted metal-dependent phosphoesterase TrpH
VRIDLHAHSNVSDGTQAPAGVMESAAAAGLDVIALTDHDSTAGWA